MWTGRRITLSWTLRWSVAMCSTLAMLPIRNCLRLNTWTSLWIKVATWDHLLKVARKPILSRSTGTSLNSIARMLLKWIPKWILKWIPKWIPRWTLGWTVETILPLRSKDKQESQTPVLVTTMMTTLVIINKNN